MSYILLHVLAYNLKDKSSACCCHYDPSHLLMLSNTRPARKGETDKELLLWGWKTVNYRCCRKKRIKKKTELNGEVKIIEGRVKTWIPLWAEMQKKKKKPNTHFIYSTEWKKIPARLSRSHWLLPYYILVWADMLSIGPSWKWRNETENAARTPTMRSFRRY